MTDEIKINESTIKWMRRVLFVLLVLSCYFVVYAAWDDLNNPGSTTARSYQSYAQVTLVAMVLTALPLWMVKLQRIESWIESMKSIDDPVLRNRAYWATFRPIVVQVIFVVVMTVIAYVVVNTYFHIPDAVIENYTSYYDRSVNYSYWSNISDINETIGHP